MAEISQVEDAWEQFVRLGLTDDAGNGITPITYMNSTAAIKAFCGERGRDGLTSSNAKGAFDWAFSSNEKIFFLPDQHLGRNTGFARGIPLEDMVVGIRTCSRRPDRRAPAQAKVILWKGHCSVHQRFLPEHVVRSRQLSGHAGHRPSECRWEVCQKADGMVRPPHHQSSAAIARGIVVCHRHGIHLVNRLAKENPDKRVITLDNSGCLCTTMFRIRRSISAGPWRTWWTAMSSIKINSEENVRGGRASHLIGC